MDNGRENLPEDYEPCGECGFDHGYEYEEAFKWHNHKRVEDIADAQARGVIHEVQGQCSEVHCPSSP